MTDDLLASDIAAAANGDRAAASRILEALQGPIYRLAVRMLGHPHDAEDATQEILLIVLTHIGSFRGDSAVTTWAWRIAANHLVRTKRGRLERVTFDSIAELLDSGLRDTAPELSDAELQLFVREVRLRCTEAMILALDRDLRIAFALVEILGLSNAEAAAVLELPEVTFRKRLSRARARLLAFMRERCGIYADANRCRCHAQVGSALDRGMLSRDELVYAIHPARDREVARVAGDVDELMRVADVLRHPAYAPPTSLLERVRALLASKRDLFDA